MGSVAISIQLCLSEMLVKQDRVRLGCQSWPLWEDLVSTEPANEKTVTNHIHDVSHDEYSINDSKHQNWSQVHSTTTLLNSPFPL